VKVAVQADHLVGFVYLSRDGTVLAQRLKRSAPLRGIDPILIHVNPGWNAAAKIALDVVARNETDE